MALKKLTAAQRAAFLAAARSYIGTPFRHVGRSARGVDCLGLVVLSLAAVGREVQDKPNYGRDPSKDGLREAARAHFGDPVKTLKPGDIVLMQWHGQPNHVSIVGDYPLGGLSLIHCLAQEKRVVEHRLAGHWPRRILEGYRP